MPKFRALHLAIGQATQQRDAQARKHAQAQKTLQHAQGQMAQLQTYASDTDARWTGGQALGLSAELIRHHYQFMDRLQHAVQQQQGVIASLDQQRLAEHQALLRAEYRLAGFQQVLKGRQAELRVVQQRREQRATDEFAAMSHYRKRANQMQEDML